jgi:hypothetical protein
VASAEALPLVLYDDCFSGINVFLFQKKNLKKLGGPAKSNLQHSKGAIP